MDGEGLEIIITMQKKDQNIFWKWRKRKIQNMLCRKIKKKI